MREIRRFRGIPLFMILLAALGSWSIASAQSTTATVKGTVMSNQGTPVAGAMIVATNVANGFKRDTTAYNDGTYSLTGLPPGTYSIGVSSEAYSQKTQTLMVQVGQNLTMDFRLAPSQVVTENITVVANQAVETKTHEAATNVTPQQIENLPQAERNFLNFAALAPGIRLSNDPLKKTIAGDAQPAEQTNVFIDGVSMKNDMLEGGVSGQNSSRGNPFPQNAVQEFRVITQNYSAQYDKASSAIITAVTKSGGNSFDGQAFVFYQPNSWVAKLPSGVNFSTLATNQDYRRYQTGINVGGPIIKDALNYFLSYEGDDQHATSGVTIGNPAANMGRFGSAVGTFASPFKSTLGFGKLSWQPGSSMLLDLSANYRHEHEIRDFGNQTSFQAASDVKNYTSGATLRDQWNSSSALNQALLSLQKYGWNPTALNPDLVGLDYEGVIRLGGRSDSQKFDQRRVELRDDFNFAPMHVAGEHNLQVGGNYDALHYRVNKDQLGNPLYSFRIDPANKLTFDQPYQARFGFGDPNLSLSNNEYGIYGQDNWNVNSHFTANLGLRWDYESHMLDQSYVTPANIATGLAGRFTPPSGNSTDYFSNGSSRKPYKGEFQPRLGVTYDLHGDSKTVLFAGAGRYYDRLFLNASLDERYRLQHPVYSIQFSPDGLPRNGSPTIKWDPSYLTKAGLLALVNQASTNAKPEIFLVNNNTRPPSSDQFNLGIRQALGTWLGSVSLNSVRGKNGLTWVNAGGIGFGPIPGVNDFGTVWINDTKDYWYNALFLSLDRPFTARNGALGWGTHLAWTHGRAQQNGNDAFSADFPSAATFPKHDVPGSERDRIVASGIFGLPWDVRFSTLISLGSGGATNLLDFSKGFSLQNRIDSRAYAGTLYPPKTWGFADRSVDLSLEKTFRFMGAGSLGLRAEAFNVFNWHNYGCIDNFLGPDGNTNLGHANCLTSLGRRLQAGVRIGF
jgi:hypothetical protein